MADRTLDFLRTNKPHGDQAIARHQAHLPERNVRQRFYDLERDPIMCPICGTSYNITITAAAAAAAAAEEKAARKAAKKPAFVEPEAVTDESALVEGAEALPEIEGEEEPAAAEADETFLEEEEETGDVSTIIGDVAEGEEEV